MQVNTTEKRLERMEESLSRIEHALGCSPDQMKVAQEHVKKWREAQEKRVAAIMGEREAAGKGDTWNEDDEFRSQMS